MDVTEVREGAKAMSQPEFSLDNQSIVLSWRPISLNLLRRRGIQCNLTTICLTVGHASLLRFLAGIKSNIRLVCTQQ